jgi:hypothetical protein
MNDIINHNIPGDVGLSGYNTESLTVDHSERSDWRVSRSLHPKGLYISHVYGNYLCYMMRVFPHLKKKTTWK